MPAQPGVQGRIVWAHQQVQCNLHTFCRITLEVGPSMTFIHLQIILTMRVGYRMQQVLIVRQEYLEYKSTRVDLKFTRALRQTTASMVHEAQLAAMSPCPEKAPTRLRWTRDAGVSGAPVLTTPFPIREQGEGSQASSCRDSPEGDSRIWSPTFSFPTYPSAADFRMLSTFRKRSRRPLQAHWAETSVRTPRDRLGRCRLSDKR